MWIVRLALRRPYTFVVASLLLLLVTPFVLLRTPTDIFPAINIPVVSIVWNFTGLSAKDIEQRMVYSEERALTTTVNNIQHIESTSYDSIGVIKVFFQQGVSPEGAVAQITAISQTILNNFRQVRRHHSSSNTTPRQCRFCSMASAAALFPSNKSLMTP